MLGPFYCMHLNYFFSLEPYHKAQHNVVHKIMMFNTVSGNINVGSMFQQSPDR